MKDPDRLLDGEGTDLELHLLRAALAEKPSARGKRRAARALWSATALGLWASSAAAGAPSFKVGLASAAKLLVAAVATAALGIAVWRSTRPEPPSGVPPAPPRAVVEVPKAVAPVSNSASPQVVSTAVPAPKRVPPRQSDSSSTIGAQLKMIEAARSALVSGNSGRCLELLDGYQAAYPRGNLSQEATLLRVEALLRAGRRAEAEALARRFRAAHPKSPYTQRLRSLLGGF